MAKRVVAKIVNVTEDIKVNDLVCIELNDEGNYEIRKCTAEDAGSDLFFI